jgi:hypothetical protein
MSPEEMLLVAGVAMVALAALRLVRVMRFGRTPLPVGIGRWPFLAGFLLVPPILLGGFGAVPSYIGIVLALVVAMWIVAALIDKPQMSRGGWLLRLALMGGEGDGLDSGLTPVTPRLAESIGLVSRANAAFPRGHGFAGQVDRAGFRGDWEALDDATRTLEGRIAEDDHAGLGVSASATAVAEDARSRLNALRRFADDRGQAWASTGA